MCRLGLDYISGIFSWIFCWEGILRTGTPTASSIVVDAGAVAPWELARLRPRVSKDSEFMN